MLPKGVLFDLDDTLLDRSAALARYSEKLASDFGTRLLNGTPNRVHAALKAADDFGSHRQAVALAAALAWREPVSADELLQHWTDHFGRMAVFFADATKVLSELATRQIALGLVTNGTAAMQRSKVVALNLERFMSAIIISGEVGCAKPEPGILNLALRHVGCDPSEAWFVGDHPVLDIAGAEAAGLRAFWVRTGRVAPTDREPTLALRNLSELLMYVA